MGKSDWIKAGSRSRGRNSHLTGQHRFALNPGLAAEAEHRVQLNARGAILCRELSAELTVAPGCGRQASAC